MAIECSVVANFLSNRNFSDLFAYLESSEVSDFYCHLNMPFRYKLTSGEFIIGEQDYLPSLEDLEELGKSFTFGENSHRAVWENGLHRVSCIKSRQPEELVGLTFRIARFIPDSLVLVNDVFEDLSKNVLIVGKPGSGKTTMLRTIAAFLSEIAHTVVVDKSNEICGDGLSPAPELGFVSRISVPFGRDQHLSIIEGVENHSPDVLIVDEISNKTEADSIKEACQKGVTVVATLHGDSLQSCVLNPVALRLLGGTNSATLGDKKVKKEGLAKKTVVEQVSKSVFDTVIVIKSKTEVEIFRDVDLAVSKALMGEACRGEWRILKTEDKSKFAVLGYERN